jgi:hypothetical protein
VSILGKPQFAEYPIISSVLGEGDLLYIFDNAVALVIECKRVVGRPSSYKQKVKEQAIKYAKVVEVLRPDLTVYGIIYTELGFMMVEAFGEPRFPASIADFLDNIAIDL